MSTHVPATVRVVGPPNSNFLIGYPGISSTMPRIEGKVEIRPSVGFSAPFKVAHVRIALQRRETIHPTADGMRKHIAAPRKEITDIVGTETLLYRCPPSMEFDSFLLMDLPFCIFIPFGRGSEEVGRRVPPASLQLPSRTAETMYELVVTLQSSHAEQKKFHFAVPIMRYDTLSSFGMYDKPESAESVSDHIVTLSISIPRWSYGPLDPISVYISLQPNQDWMSKAKKVTVKSLSMAVEEEVVFNHQGDDTQSKTKTLARTSQTVGMKLAEAGYMTNLGLVFPQKDLRDSDGIIPRGKKEFPLYQVGAFTTTGSLYKIQYYLTVKASLSGAKDITLRKPIVVCPFDYSYCRDIMKSIEESAREASRIQLDSPMVPAPYIIKHDNLEGLRPLGLCMVGGDKKLLIE